MMAVCLATSSFSHVWIVATMGLMVLALALVNTERPAVRRVLWTTGAAFSGVLAYVLVAVPEGACDSWLTCWLYCCCW